MNARASTRWALLATITTLTASRIAHAQESPAPTAPQANEEARREAKRLFDRGVKHLEENRFDEALTDFRRSREVFPTRSATENAAICLRELGKTADAFELFRSMLKEFPDLPPEVRTRVETQVTQLDAQLGRLVFVADPGTAVTVDGRPLGKLPFTEPVRVVAGRNVVRMYLDGYSVFETQVSSERGKETVVEPRFELLGTVGRLRVKERSGAQAEVVVDGVVVGKTPWEGALSPGDHAVWLTAEGGRGTAPSRARVLLGQRTESVLVLSPLVSSVRVSTTPQNAVVSLDGVAIGTGPVDLQLPAGRYELSASHEGYEPHAEVVLIETGSNPKLQFTLEEATKHAVDPFEIGVAGAATLSPELDGVACEGCARGVAAGGYVSIVGGYRLPFGLGFELELGYHRASSTLERDVPLTPVGLSPIDTRFTESYFMTGATVLAGASYRPPLGSVLFLVAGSHFGAYLGGASVTRNAAGSDSGEGAFSIGPYQSGSELAGIVIKPELRGGISLTSWLDLWISGAAMFVFPVSVEPWGYTELVPLGDDGASRFATEELWGPHVHLMPGLGLGVSL